MALVVEQLIVVVAAGDFGLLCDCDNNLTAIAT